MIPVGNVGDPWASIAPGGGSWALAPAAPAEPVEHPADGSECAVYVEATDYPDAAGRVTVTGICECGRTMGTYRDSIV